MRYNVKSLGVACRAPTGVPHVNDNRYVGVGIAHRTLLLSKLPIASHREGMASLKIFR